MPWSGPFVHRMPASIRSYMADSSGNVAEYLWNVAAARAAGDSSRSTTAIALFSENDANAVITAAINEIIELVGAQAHDQQTNPACWGKAATEFLAPRLRVPGSEKLMVEATQVLIDADPTGESLAPHDGCTPWEKDLPLPRIEQYGGGLFLADAAERLRSDRVDSVAEIAVAAAEVLTRLAWSIARSDRIDFQHFLESRATPMRPLEQVRVSAEGAGLTF